LVEPSCGISIIFVVFILFLGAGLAVVYENLPVLQEILKGKTSPTILLIVCGGNAVSVQMLQDWKQQFNI
jgi:hypothetical protein